MVFARRNKGYTLGIRLWKITKIGLIGSSFDRLGLAPTVALVAWHLYVFSVGEC